MWSGAEASHRAADRGLHRGQPLLPPGAWTPVRAGTPVRVQGAGGQFAQPRDLGRELRLEPG